MLIYAVVPVVVLQPAECSALIEKIKSCSEDDLLVELKQIRNWTFGKVSARSSTMKPPTRAASMSLRSPLANASICHFVTVDILIRN